MRLERSTHPLTSSGIDVGRVESNKKIARMLLTLSFSSQKQEALSKLLEEQQNPGSENYHRWISPAEFGRRFGAETSDIQRVRVWLESNGFVVANVPRSGHWLEFSGTASQVENAFRTEMHYFRVEGQQYLANATDISLPQSIAQVSHGVVSLNNLPKHPPTLVPRGFAGINEQGQKTGLSPNLTAAGNSNTYYVGPGDFAAIYNTKPLLAGGTDGSGITIAITAQSQIELTDVQQFRQIFGLKVNDPNVIVDGPDPGITTPTDQQEATLDTEWAGAVAPGATIDLVIAGTTSSTYGVDLAAAYAIDNQIAPILTYTYGSCEQLLQSSGNAFYNALWQQAAAEGITVFVATGDNGSAACDAPGTSATLGKAVNGAASTPFNVAVAGTQFSETGMDATYWSTSNASDYSSALGYISESAWNESCDTSQPFSSTNCLFSNGNFSSLASGGGASTIYAKPSWQAGTGVPTDGTRDIPDIALAAASGHDALVYCNSLGGIPCEINSQNQVVGLSLVGGTSASTPAMAGILALVEQKNGAFQGQVNNTLYKLAQNSGASCDSSAQTNPTAQNSCIFYDITTGSNAVPCAGGTPDCSSTQGGVDGFLNGQVAGTGYDLVTGLGSVNAANLANSWKNVTFLASQTQLLLPTTSFVHGTAITVSGTVVAASGNGSPTGSVSLRTSASQNTDNLPVTGGSFSSASIVDLPGGQYALTAHYSGDATYAPSDSNSIGVNITPENSTITLTATGLRTISTPYGTPVQFLAKVQGLSGAGSASGTITLQDGSTMVGTYPLAQDGSAFISTGAGSAYSFSVGDHTLIANYGGDPSLNSSSSSAVTFTIGKSKPTVIVGINSNTVSTTQPIAAHVNVVGFGTALATGSVQFTVDGNAYNASVPLQAGGLFNTSAQASILISGLAAGSHVIGATYDGSADANYMTVNTGDTNNELTQTVNITAPSGTATTTTLAPVTLPVNLGDTGKFTVSVSPTVATGTVTLWDVVGPRSSATPITNGTTTIQIPWTQGGSIALYAVYSGDPSYAPSSSKSVPFTVSPGTPVVALSAPSQVTTVQQASLIATVAGVPNNSSLPYPTGMVQFWDSLNGGAAQLLATENLTAGAGHIGVYGLRTKLPAGTHALIAHYGGDNNWRAVDSPTVVVTSGASPDFSINVAPNSVSFNAGSTGTTTLTIAPSGGFTGNVSLTCPVGSSAPVAGYACGFPTTSTGSVNIVDANAVSTTLNIGPSATNTALVFPSSPDKPSWRGWRVSLAAGLLLFGIYVFSFTGSQNKRQLAFTGGCVLCIASLVVGCGGGGGEGGGAVPSTTTLSSSNLHAGSGTGVTFNVRITANSTPGGTVQLVDNGQLYSSGTVTAGVASFQTTTLPVGIHVITAQYSGDTSTLPSKSAAIAQIIAGAVQIPVTGTAASGAHSTTLTVTIN